MTPLGQRGVRESWSEDDHPRDAKDQATMLAIKQRIAAALASIGENKKANRRT